MNSEQLAAWLKANAQQLEMGSDDERRVASMLWLTFNALGLGDLPEFLEYSRAFSYRNESEGQPQ